MNEYEKKIEYFMLSHISHIKNPKILEFGVRTGTSTKKFIEICEKNDGYLYSVDIDDCSEISSSKKWKFFQCRDDNFQFLDNKLPRDFNLIYLDSFHNADHIEKILYHYYSKLKVGGYFIIDDISWLPYVLDNYRNNFHCEINNRESFFKLLKINRSNNENFDLHFSFVGSGLAKIIKLNSNQLQSPKIVISRNLSLKNITRKLVKYFIK